MPEIISSIYLPFETEEASPTRGITAKVVKGSFWNLMSQVVPLFASLLSTPFIIRFLGSEGYGVLVLIGLIPTYFSFADFGMGVASTKFGSEAYAQGAKQKEGEIVRVAAFIALLTSLIFAIPIFVFSSFVVRDLANVPEQWQTQASIALKITLISFVLGILASVFNTPQLTRLRMELSAYIGVGTKLLVALSLPTVLYLGGGIIAAASVALLTTLLALVAHFLVSGSLLGELYQTTINRNLFRPLLKFGGGLLISTIAAILLINVEKIFLTRLISVQSLAYYSVAFTFANMATMFSVSMVQSLIPAFSQLLLPERKEEFNLLFARMTKINFVWLLPSAMFLFVVAKPFFTVWAGKDFGIQSSVPFYLLLVGLLFNIIAYIPHSSITASGRTDILAKVYWIEVVPYILLVIVLIHLFGIVGAALAWSLRSIVDTVVFIWLSKKIVGVSLGFLNHLSNLFLGLLILLPPVLFAAFYDNFSLWLIILSPVCAAIYLVFVWQTLITYEEKNWIKIIINKRLQKKR